MEIFRYQVQFDVRIEAFSEYEADEIASLLSLVPQKGVVEINDGLQYILMYKLKQQWREKASQHSSEHGTEVTAVSKEN
jgi:hypothetical protein